MKKILAVIFIVGLICNNSNSQTILYNQNFGVSPINGFPNGWTATGIYGWNMSSSVVSTGYVGASGGVNFKTGTIAGSPDTLIFSSISTIGYNNICVLWAGRKTATQNSYPVFEWSIDSIVWTPVLYSDVSSASTWSLVNAGISISLPASAGGVNNLRFRWIVSTTTTGSYRIDDFIVSSCSSSIATLPTCFAWDVDTISGFVTPFPNGWLSYGLGTPYNTGHIAPNSGKFDTQDDSLVIHFNSVADSLIYWLKGNTLSGIYQFDIFESADGINYSILDIYSAISGSWTFHSNIPDTASRYIKFVYTTKDNGNIAIDDVCLISSTTNIHTLNIYNEISIYPNPVTNTLFINNIINVDKISITDIYGKQVKILDNVKGNNIEISVNNLPEGIYIITFYNNNNSISKNLKFVK